MEERAAWWLKPLYDRLLVFIRSHPMYDFDDRNLPVGAAYWVALTEHYLR